MFEKVGEKAEQVVTSVSRREFLGRFGRGAMVLAAAVGGLLALPSIGAAKQPGTPCGSGSSFGCVGSMVGDHCTEGGRSGISGTCKPIDNSSTACICKYHDHSR